MGPNITVEEEENKFYQWVDQYDQWDTTSYTPVTDNNVEGSHKFNLNNLLFNLTKIKRDRTSKTVRLFELVKGVNSSES